MRAALERQGFSLRVMLMADQLPGKSPFGVTAASAPQGSPSAAHPADGGKEPHAH